MTVRRQIIPASHCRDAIESELAQRFEMRCHARLRGHDKIKAPNNSFGASFQEQL
jgi:hypothetical protein